MKDMKINYKGLVIAHNPLSTQTNNGKTYASLLSEFSKEQLCQIYVTNLEPDLKLANSFFKLSEKKIIGNRRQNIGGEITSRAGEDNISTEQTIKKSNPLLFKIRKCITKFVYSQTGQAIRSFLWGKDSLFSQELREWIEEERPDYVFWGNGNINAMLDLVLEICKEYNLPLVVNLGDDYFSTRKSINVIYKKYQKKLQKSFAKIVNYAEVIIVCSDKMETVLKNEFGGNYLIAMNSIDSNEKFEEREISGKNSISIVYTGNIGIGRWKTLLRVGNILEKKQSNINFHLDIYTGEELETNLIKKLDDCSCISLKKAVYGEELHRVRDNADIMIFVETFDKNYEDLLSTAVSTKVPEYMNTRRAILAIGPAYSAAVDYYKRNDVAEVVTSLGEKEIEKALDNVLQNELKRKERIDKGYKLVEKEHLRENNARKVKEYIVKGIEKN